MVTKAQARAAAKKLNNLTCQMVDAQSLKQFDDASQDVVTVCYGLMFMPDLVRVSSSLWPRLWPISIRSDSLQLPALSCPPTSLVPLTRSPRLTLTLSRAPGGRALGDATSAQAGRRAGTQNTRCYGVHSPY
jgi:hypothetical protein